jgi:PhzF family phenazine biosynthesis protein
MSGLKIPVYQVDAFASRVFSGNPAAVCPLKKWLPDEQMQAIAAENNLPMTAFFVPNPDGYDIRWFTPEVEVALCGHATLASAFIIFHDLAPAAKSVRFETKSGALVVTRDGDLLSMDFPSRPPVACEFSPELAAMLGSQPEAMLKARDYMAVYATEEEVKKVAPDLDALKQMDTFGLIVTAPGKQVDFVSRFFAPAQGILEDPVTGSAHCTLIPYWSKRLGKKKLHAQQVSARGGELWCEDRGERVSISGKAVRFLEGSIYL